MKLEEIRWSNFRGNRRTSRIKEVLSDLKKGSDIEGAMLIEGNDAIIACDLPARANYDKEIPEVLAMLEELCGQTTNELNEVMFAQQIFDFNGHKILAKKLKDKLTLLVMMQKRGYISLAMLDIENSIRRIDEILQNKPFN